MSIYEKSIIKVSHIEESTNLLGPYNRFVIWVHGCCFDCEGCLAENTKNGVYEEVEIDLLAKRVAKSPCEGITISGGEPFLQANAKESFRHYYSKVKPIAAFVSSDGVEESFDQAGLYNFFYSIAYWLKEEGFDTAKAKVEGLLPQISEGGSGDDVSVAVMVSKEDAIAKPRQTLEQIYERVTACENVLNQVKNLLADTKDRLSEKDKESTSLEKEIAKLKAELEEKESAHKKTIAGQEALQRSVDELDAKAQRAAEQMDKASKYKASAERYWFAEFEKIGLKYQPPVEAVEVNYLQDDAENQKEAAEDSSNVVDDSSSHVDASESTVIATGERNPIDQIEHIDDTALATQPEPDYPGAYNDVKREPTQEQPLVEVKEKTAKHFWPFSKQSR